MGSYGQNWKPNFDQKISLFQPSNLSKALILEPRGPQPLYSDIWASLGSLDPDQQQSQNFSLLVLISNQVSQRHGILMNFLLLFSTLLLHSGVGSWVVEVRSLLMLSSKNPSLNCHSKHHISHLSNRAVQEPSLILFSWMYVLTISCIWLYICIRVQAENKKKYPPALFGTGLTQKTIWQQFFWHRVPSSLTTRAF